METDHTLDWKSEIWVIILALSLLIMSRWVVNFTEPPTPFCNMISNAQPGQIFYDFKDL